MIILKKYITRYYIKSHPEKIFIFGDNDMRGGFGGQAREMRGEPNSIGIRTKKIPGNIGFAYYLDKDYEINISKIIEDFNIVETFLKGGKDVIIPKDGIGTGLAKLKIFAPKTLEFINNKIKELCTEYGVQEED